MFVPTYWQVHHYPSLTLTVSDPLIHKQVFPAAFTGAMVHGSKYFEDGGMTYSLFAGNGRGPDLGRSDVNDHKATGGKFVAHVPNRRFFDTLDLGVIWYRDKLANRDRESIYGFESRIEKGRLGFLGEFAHGDINLDGGPRRFFREGYYLQPSLRLGGPLRFVYRYDTFNADSRLADGATDRHSIGLNFRPRPTVSLKLEFNRYRPEARERATSHGVAAGVAFFFQ